VRYASSGTKLGPQPEDDGDILTPWTCRYNCTTTITAKTNRLQIIKTITTIKPTMTTTKQTIQIQLHADHR